MGEAEKPLPQHDWLQQLVGEWTSESTAKMGPGKPDATSNGKEVVRSIGGLWVVSDATGDMPGTQTPVHSIMKIGFDAKKSKYVSCFIASVMSSMWHHEGDVEGNKLILKTRGPRWTDPTKVADFVEELEIVSPDHKILKSYCIEDDNTFHYLTVQYHRVK